MCAVVPVHCLSKADCLRLSDMGAYKCGAKVGYVVACGGLRWPVEACGDWRGLWWPVEACDDFRGGLEWWPEVLAWSDGL